MNDESFDPETHLSMAAQARDGMPKAKPAMPPLVQPPVYARTRGAAPVVSAGPARPAQVQAAPGAVDHDPDVRVPDSLRRALMGQQTRAPAPQAPEIHPEAQIHHDEPQATRQAPPLRRVSPEPRLAAAQPQVTAAVEPLFRHRAAQAAQRYQQAPAQSYDEPQYAEASQPAPRLAAVAPGWAAEAYTPPPHKPTRSQPAYTPETSAWDDEAYADMTSAEPAPRMMSDPPQRAPQQPARPLQHEPMAVLWQGHEVAAWDWNTNGFVLVTPFPYPVDAGRIVPLTLLIGQGIARLSISVRAQRDPIEPTLFSFIGLSQPQEQLLARISAHQGPSLAQLLADPAPARIERSYDEPTHFELEPAERFTAQPAVAPPEPTQAAAAPAVPRRRSYRPSLRWMFVLAVLGTSGAIYWDSNAKVTSRYGAVTTSATALTVPAAGTLAQMNLRDGQAVTTGEVLGYVRPRSYVEAEPTRLITLSEDLIGTNSFGTDAAVSAALASSDGVTADSQGLSSLAGSTLTPDLPLDSSLAARANPGRPILSPCDCTVRQVSQQNGDWIEPGDTLAQLVGNDAPTIHALVLATTARNITLGDRAIIRLADGSTVTGRVNRVSPEAIWPGYTGLSDTVFAAERYARLDVAPDVPLSAAVGTDAQVTVQTSALLGWVHAQIGL